MNIFLMAGFFTNIINTIFRDVPDYVRYPLIFVFVILSVWCLAKCIKKKDDKHPINYSYVVLAAVLMALAFAYIFIR